MPENIDGVDVPNGLDYQWVKFIINDIDASGAYSHNNRKYDPDEVMNVMGVLQLYTRAEEAFRQ